MVIGYDIMRSTFAVVCNASDFIGNAQFEKVYCEAIKLRSTLTFFLCNEKLNFQAFQILLYKFTRNLDRWKD